MGFDRENLLLVWAAPVRTGRTVPALVDFAKSVQERLSSLPGVLSASVSNGGVLEGSMRRWTEQRETLQISGAGA